MLAIIENGEKYPLTLDGDAWYIRHPFDGLEILTFEVSPEHELYSKIGEEVRVTDETNIYIIKKIDEYQMTTVTCDIDLDDWRERMIPSFRTTDMTLGQVLDQIKPSGWRVANAGIVTKRTTIEASEGTPYEYVTPYDLLAPIASAYGVTFHYSVIDRAITVIVPSAFTPSGEYLTEDLNLKSVQYTGDSSTFATRLYAKGKDDLTFADINGGKDYVDDNSYSDRVISVGWKDERYTVAENLLAAAKKRLKEMAYPARSYSCAVIDLARLHPEYQFLHFALYRVVALVDKRRKTRIAHQIVEYIEYPDAPEKNVVTLSSTVPRIESTINNVYDTIIKGDDTVRSDAQHATDLLAGAEGGHVVLRLVNGKPVEQLIMDADSIETARRVWRWNIAGLGYSSTGYYGTYGTAITMDGRIVADYISTGRLQGRDGKSYWDFDSGELVLSGVFRQYAKNSMKSIDILNNQVRFYDWANNGSFVGAFASKNVEGGKAPALGVGGGENCGLGLGMWMNDQQPNSYFDEYMTIWDPETKSPILLRRNMTLGGMMYSTPGRTDGIFNNSNYELSIGSQVAVNLGITSGTYQESEYITSILALYPGKMQAYADLDMGRHHIVNAANMVASTSVRSLGAQNGAITATAADGETYAILPHTSDARLKEDIGPCDISALDELSKIPHRSYRRKDNGELVRCGYIAQELERINPRYVLRVPQVGSNGEVSDEVLQIREQSILPLLTKAIQELQSKNADLESKIEALSNAQHIEVPAKMCIAHKEDVPSWVVELSHQRIHRPKQEDEGPIEAPKIACKEVQGAKNAR